MMRSDPTPGSPKIWCQRICRLKQKTKAEEGAEDAAPSAAPAPADEPVLASCVFVLPGRFM